MLWLVVSPEAYDEGLRFLYDGGRRFIYKPQISTISPRIMKELISKILAWIHPHSCKTIKHLTKPGVPREFNDEYIEIKFEIFPGTTHLSLTNKSDKEIILDWENVRFIDLHGKSNKIICFEAKESQGVYTYTPQNIAPHTTIHDYLASVTGGLLVPPIDNWRLRNKKVKVKIPIIIEGDRKEYVFILDPLEYYMKWKMMTGKALWRNY